MSKGLKRMSKIKQDFNHWLATVNSTDRDKKLYSYFIPLLLVLVWGSLICPMLVLLYHRYLHLGNNALYVLTNLLNLALLSYVIVNLISLGFGYLLFRIGSVFGDDAYLTKGYVRYISLMNFAVVLYIGSFCLLADFGLASLNLLLWAVSVGIPAVVSFGSVWGMTLPALVASKINLVIQVFFLVLANGFTYIYLSHAGLITKVGMDQYLMLALVLGIVPYVLNFALANRHNCLHAPA